jgi:AcrR family transcriptional regulator
VAIVGDVEERIDGRRLRYQHRRGDLLDAVSEYVLDNGVTTLSLRQVAKAVGVSHVTLQHHFGSKEQLIGEIVERLLERTFTPQGDYLDLNRGGSVRDLWSHWNSPAGRRDIRLFIEVLGQGQFGRSGYSLAVRRSIEHRLALIAERLRNVGCTEEEARVHSTIALAVVRGLMSDMLATGDRARVDDAFEIYLAEEAKQIKRWSSRTSAPVTTAPNGTTPSTDGTPQMV